MTFYNVKLSIVDLIDAGSADEATAILRQRVNSAGLTVYDGDEPDAFESENLADRELEDLRIYVVEQSAGIREQRASAAGEALLRLRQWEVAHGDTKNNESRAVRYLILHKLLGMSHDAASRASRPD